MQWHPATAVAGRRHAGTTSRIEGLLCQCANLEMLLASASPHQSSDLGKRREINWILLLGIIDRYSHTKTETAPEDGLDPTGEAIGVVEEKYHERRRLSTLDAGESACSCGLPRPLSFDFTPTSHPTMPLALVSEPVSQPVLSQVHLIAGDRLGQRHPQGVQVRGFIQ